MDRKQLRVLMAGESWITYATHIKGFDSFTTSEYQEGGRWLIDGLKKNGMAVDYLPNHQASELFPSTMKELEPYDVVILSDIGSNSLLLHPDTFFRSRRTPNRLDLLQEFVESGKGFMMIGGYMSFQGIDGKARYRGTPIETILPVSLEPGDDRVEVPQGFSPAILLPDHPIMQGIPTDWPFLLFFNQTHPKEGATVIAEHNGYPILAAHEWQAGRTIAYTPDCGPAGSPPEFLNWPHYSTLWTRMVQWLAGQI